MFNFNSIVMKKLKSLFAIVIFVITMNLLNAQTPGSWILPDEFVVNQVIFGPNGPYLADPPFSPGGYFQGDDKLFSAGGYDENENLVFYVVDQQLIDHVINSVVGNFIFGNPVNNNDLSPELEIIRVPDSEDNSYFVFYTRRIVSDQGFCYTEVYHDGYTTNIGAKKFYEDNGVYNGAIAIGEEKVIEEEIIRDLYYCTADFGIRKRIINSDGVSGSSEQIVYPNDPFYENYLNFAAYNMEMIENADGEVLLAWIVRGNEGFDHLFMYNVDEPTQYNIEIGHGRINGIEFSQVDDNIIYLSCSGAANPGIYAYNISDETSEYLANSEDYCRTYLQAAKDGHIYAASIDGDYLGRINMTTGNFDTDVLEVGNGIVTHITLSEDSYYILPENSNYVFYFDLEINFSYLDCPGDCNGQATAIPTNGEIDDFTWEWTDESQNVISTTNEASNLCEGHYTVEATHIASGKTISKGVDIELNPGLWNYTEVFEFTSSSEPPSPWDYETLSFVKGLTIKSGETLELKNNTTLKFGEGAKLIIERGALLIVDNSTLINHNVCPVLWKGVEVWGTSGQGQYPEYQGWVEVINGGTIENSLMGIYTNKPSETEESWEPEYTGGIVWCDSAYFINNKVAAQFFQYGFTSMSHFNDCMFETNEDYLGSTNPEFFIDATGILQLRINNCDFLNASTTPYLHSGINCFNSILLVEGDCLEGDPCTSWDNGNFQNLEYGIYATASTSTKYVDIRHTDFTDNYRGLYISGMTAPRVTSNRFYINETFQPGGGYGMYLDHSTGYWVEDNDYIHEGENRLGIGLIVHHSGTAANEIYRNRFINLTQGISAQEQNKGLRTGLQIKCNDFDECDADILVPMVTTEGYGIASNQGSNSTLPQNMAGNLFYIPGLSNGDFDDINNQAASLTYYYPINSETPRTEPIDYTLATVTKWGKNVNPQWSYENGCPSHIEGGGGGGGNGLLINTITESDDAIEANESLLAEIIDGGNTENLDTEVENSVPPEAEQVYTELMNHSPYLSETVVSTSIEKENVLPNAMIRDVMVANPHTAKSDDLIEKLDVRSNPMPDYMKAQVLEGRDVMTQKQSVESDIANHKLIKARAFNELIRQFLGNAENAQISPDSLEQLYEQDNELESKYRLAVLKLEIGDYTGGTAVLENLPVQYGLSGDDLTAHDQMTELFDILSGIHTSGRTLTEADSTEVQQLALIESGGDNPANIYARNILLSLSALSYDEPVQLPDLMKSSAATEEYEKLLNAKPPRMLEVYPNPSKDFVIIGYATGEETSASQEGSIEIQDATGRIIQTIAFKSLRDQVTLITRDWKSGVYLASLKLNGNIIESIKFTLVK